MILIDIDKVINDPSVFAIGKEEIEKYTVKAIPVKWIRQWFAENSFKVYDDDEGFLIVGDIEEMLLDWEKENENRVE